MCVVCRQSQKRSSEASPLSARHEASVVAETLTKSNLNNLAERDSLLFKHPKRVCRCRRSGCSQSRQRHVDGLTTKCLASSILKVVVGDYNESKIEDLSRRQIP